MGRAVVADLGCGLTAADLERLDLEVSRLKDECGVPNIPWLSVMEDG